MELTSVKSDLWSVPEITLSYSKTFSTIGRPRICNEKDAYNFLIANWDSDRMFLQEEFKVVLLNQSQRVLGIYSHSIGGITGTICDIRLVVGCALKALACGIIVAHNHPSGNLEPSRQDIYLTGKLVQACSLFDIKLKDHMIISDESYYSFADQGNL